MGLGLGLGSGLGLGLGSKAEAACESVPSWRSVSCRWPATRLCTKESALDGRPKSIGVSCAGSVPMRAT